MNIIYTDDAIVVAEKEAGILSQEGKGEKGMPELLREILGGEIFCIHRLDRETGGLMVFARTGESAAFLSDALREKKFKKHYWAVFSGMTEAPSGSMEDLLFYDRAKGKVFPVKRERKGVKKALLHYSIKQTENGFSLADVEPVTGRTHQIRVQFASRKHPLYGDRKYGGKGSSLGLFAYRLEFLHPITKKRLSFSAKPKDEAPWNLFSPSHFDLDQKEE